MARFGIIANLTKDKGLEFTSSIIKWLEDKDCKVCLSEISASKLSRSDIGYSHDEMYSICDYLIVLGGDGTLLGVARGAFLSGIPLLGINMGNLGFITEVEKEDAFFALQRIIDGEYSIQERILLQANVIRDGEIGDNLYCLNDVNIAKGTLSRMITLNTYSDGEFVDDYHADGLIISTPTGSTAYSLSAGGPIISPEVGVMLMTPICPHTLYSRSIVIADSKEITVEIERDADEIFLTCDGQQGQKLSKLDKVIVKKAPANVKFIKLGNRGFYDVLRNKFRQRNF
ncbi:MAG: NAD(+)/NADH kinase [Clostridium sp.]|uniref:NAD(+)/NADH kinase n=1 Tax=Clostridium sp. TaxID=1506 RepID=UPI002FCA15DE